MRLRVRFITFRLHFHRRLVTQHAADSQPVQRLDASRRVKQTPNEGNLLSYLSSSFRQKEIRSMCMFIRVPCVSIRSADMRSVLQGQQLKAAAAERNLPHSRCAADVSRIPRGRDRRAGCSEECRGPAKAQRHSSDCHSEEEHGPEGFKRHHLCG